MIERVVTRELGARLRAYPAVALVGPRQCGKTTLAGSLGAAYFDLEQQADRLRLDLEWEALAAGNQLVVLDEAQAWPEVFPRLRGAIDGARKRTGRFLLLGSVSPTLMVEVSQSLAGRLSLLELTPLLACELPSKAAVARHWLCGGFPDGGVLDGKAYPRWHADYLALLTGRDLPTWGLPAKPRTTDRLMRMLAAVHGQTWNASRIGQSLGLSYQTVNTYLDYFEGAFLVRRLRPFQRNAGKRLVKAPKVYWRDCGLLHALGNVPDRDTLLAQPWVGASWEGYVIEQIIGELTARGVSFEPWFFRTSDQHEIDLVIDTGRERWAFEIKLTSAPSPADLGRLDKVAAMIDAQRRFLISQVSRPAGDGQRLSSDLRSALERLRELAG